MRHRVAGKQLSRSTPHRKATRRNMAASLFQHGAIRTTETKAKELRQFVEKLITQAKRGTLHARRLVIRELGDPRMYDDEGEPMDQSVVQKLFDEIAPRYGDRAGGYTRIIRLSERRIGDAGRQVLLQLVEEAPTEGEGAATSSSRRRRRGAKRHAAARAAKKARTGGSTAATEQAGEQGEPPQQDESAELDSGEDEQGESADEK